MRCGYLGEKDIDMSKARIEMLKIKVLEALAGTEFTIVDIIQHDYGKPFGIIMPWYRGIVKELRLKVVISINGVKLNLPCLINKETLECSFITYHTYYWVLRDLSHKNVTAWITEEIKNHEKAK